MQRISDLLGSEDGINRIKQMAQMFGLGSDDSEPDLSAFAGMFSGGGQKDSSSSGKTDESSRGPDLGGLGGLGDLFKNIDMGTVMRLLSAYSNTKDGENERLLRALKPMLSDKRQGRVDEAINLMKLIAIYPLVKESGLLGNLLG